MSETNGHGTMPASVPAPELVTDFVRRLRRRGVQVSVIGPPGRERLRVRAPAGRLSEADRERLRGWRAAILASLAAPAAPLATPTIPAPKSPVPQIDQIDQIPHQGLAAPGGDTKPLPQIDQIDQIRRGADPACPRCAALDRQAGEVLAQLATSPALPPALRGLPPEKLGVLVRWTIVSLSNPRPGWAPPPPPPRAGRARPSLAGAIGALGGEAVGGSDADEAPPHDAGKEPEDADG